MRRRGFLKSIAGEGGAALVLFGSDAQPKAPATPARGFLPCINQATTEKADFRTAMDAYGQAGFRAVELWLDSVEPFLQKETAAVARRVMSSHGIEPVSACCEEDLFFPRLADREMKLEQFKRKLERSAQLGAPRFVMYSAISENVTLDDYSAALPGLHRIGELARQFHITVGIEFIKGAKFLGCLETTSQLLRKAAHPNLGVLLDTFHFYAGTSKLQDIEKLNPGEISFVHVDDVPAIPREQLEDMHRVFLGEGVMPLEEILWALSRVYRGPISFEVFQYAAQDPYQVAKKAFEGLLRLLARLGSA